MNTFTRSSRHSGVALICLMCVLAASLWFTVTVSRAEEKEHWSLTILKEAFVKDKIMAEKELPFMIYDVTKKKDLAEVEVRINNAKAGRGDPNVAPLLGMFRVYQDKKILWYSVEDDEYKPWPVYVKAYAER